MPSSKRGLYAGVVDDSIDDDRKFLSALQDLIVLATDVLDSSVNTLSSKPGICAELVQKLQRVGSSWDDHDSWPGRVWYVDILMAVANLSRVLDWWQAEKGFWNFDEEDDNEPIMFVMKPGKEDSRFDRAFGAAISDYRSSPQQSLLQLPEMPNSGISLDAPSPVSTTADGGTAKQLVTPKVGSDDLKFLAEHAKSVNIVMEFSLQGEEIQYVNDAILEVIGYF